MKQSGRQWKEWTDFASRARAMTPATIGADTEVPVWPSVHLWRRSVVTCHQKHTITHVSKKGFESQGTLDVNLEWQSQTECLSGLNRCVCLSGSVCGHFICFKEMTTPVYSCAALSERMCFREVSLSVNILSLSLVLLRNSGTHTELCWWATAKQNVWHEHGSQTKFNLAKISWWRNKTTFNPVFML